MNKLREALSKASIALSWATHGHLTEGDAEKYLAIVDAALAEPLKNYEVGTQEEQAKRFDVYCHTGGGLCSSIDSCAECTIAWMHMPYEEVK
jgi:hypothetical protein